MNSNIIVRRQLALEIDYLQPQKDDEGRVIKSGILVSTEHLENELRIDVSDDPVFDESTDDFVSSGKYQINLRGTVQSFQELGTLLIALAHYQDDPDYHIHIDNVPDSSDQEPKVHLILHVPVDMT